MYYDVNMAVLGEVGIMYFLKTRISHMQVHKIHAWFAFPQMSYGFVNVIMW